MIYLMVAIASLGGVLFGYETGVAAGALRMATVGWGLDEHYHVVIGSATLLGAIMGALASGKLADIVGRRDIIMATAGLFTLGAFASAAAPSPSVLLVGRFIVGVGVGAVSLASPLYIAEIAPAKRRGFLVCVFQLMITAGILLAYVGNEISSSYPEGWRYMLALGTVPGLLLSGLALLLLESPIWLALKGDEEEARSNWDRLGRGEEEFEEMRPIIAGQSWDSDEFSQLFAPNSRKMVFLATAVFFFQQFVGINMVIYYAPGILSHMEMRLGAGFSGNALLLVAVNFVMTLVAMAMIDRVGRRPLLLASLLGMAAGLFLLTGGLGFEPLGATSERIIVLAGFLVYIAFFAVGIGPIGWVAASEVCPVHIRGLAMSLPVASHWLFDGLSSPTALLVSGDLGTPIVFAIYGVVALAGFAVFRRIYPETRGLTLLAIHRRFTELVAQGRKSMFVSYAITTMAATGGLLTGFNLAITAGALVLITAEWGLDTLAQGTLVSSIIVGLFVGSVLAGPMADRFGRRYVLMSTAALFIAGAFGCALSQSFEWLLLARFGVGVAIGIMAPTNGIYVAEIAPPEIRGRLLSFDAVTYAIGLLAAYAVSLLFEAQPDGWRYMFAVIAVPSAVYGLALLPLPESPRWLVSTGRRSAARRMLGRLEEADPDTLIEEVSRERHDDPSSGWSKLLMPRFRPAVTVGLALMFLTVFSGFDMVLFYAPTILKETGFEDNTVSFVATLGLGIVYLIMAIVSLWFVDRAGRKPMILGGLAVMALSLGVMAMIANAIGGADASTGWAMVSCLAVFVGAFALTVGPVAEVVVAEIYPQSIRGPAASLVNGARCLFAFFFSFTFPMLLVGWGVTLTFLLYAVIGALGIAYLWRMLPETKGRSLEAIAANWQSKRSRQL
jgi:sugar porter (SP) family MFS transporter